MPIDDTESFEIQVTSSQPFTQKWSKTPTQIGIIGEAPPAMLDVNNDGIKEIFWAGKPTAEPSGPEAMLVCINGATGAVIWSKRYTHYWGDGNVMSHLPVMVYDFNKDGVYEVIPAGGYSCFNALNGNVVWTASSSMPSDPNGCWRLHGWHHSAFIDRIANDYVTIYTCGGGFIRKINGKTGAQIARANLVTPFDDSPVCWGGISIANLRHTGNEFDVVVGTRGWSPYIGLQLFSEDLSVRRWNQVFTCSSQPPKLYDIDGDGQDEIIIGNQTNQKVHISKWNGSNYELTPTINVHYASTVADCDNDGHMEWISNNSASPGPVKIIDLVTGQLKATLPTGNIDLLCSVANILPYPGYELIVPQGGGIYHFDGNSFVKVYNIDSGIYNALTGDVDGDGKNEVVFTGSNGMSVWDTLISTPSPEPITQIAYGGMRRLDNNIYYPLPQM